MQALFKCSAGLDVHSKVVVAAIAEKVGEKEDEIRYSIKEFPTFRADLRKMASFLKEKNVQLAIMEGTGIYWKAVYEALEDADVSAIVVNAYHVKNVPGKKTDINDSKWLAQLGMFGLLKASFIPPRDLRELRMVTRYRMKLVGIFAGEKNRLHKTLESCGIKLGIVVSDIDGVSARQMIDALIDGKKKPEKLAKMARGRLKRKSEEIARSLDGELHDRQKFLLKQIRGHMRQIESLLAEIDEQVVAAMKPYEQEWQLIQTIPGFDQISAAMLLAEIGCDMTCFGTADRLSSWAGICPGNNESAGKKKWTHPQREPLCKKNFV